MKHILPVIVTACILTSCDHDRLDVDVSAISVPEVKIQRYDLEFFQLDTAHLPEGLKKLHDKFGVFHNSFMNHIVYRSGYDSLNRDKDLRFFLTDYALLDVENQVKNIFKDGVESYQKEMNDAFIHFRYYFPSRKLPAGIYFDMTGFNYNIMFVEGGFYGIGLEYYLGRDNLCYGQLEWPKYKSVKCSREYLVSNFVEGWMLTEFPYDPAKEDLLNKMVYQGKILYMKKALLRNAPDSVLLGYSQKQIQWCLDNEATMYSSLIEQKKIYSEDPQDMQHYTEDAPFTPDFPRESPGKAGNWIGLRIVESYMNNNPKVTIEQLMTTNDAQAILSRAKYKPKF